MAVETLTFGCRLNAYESEVMQAEALKAGLSSALIVNTCAVTAEAVRQAKQAIRKARRDAPGRVRDVAWQELAGDLAAPTDFRIDTSTVRGAVAVSIFSRELDERLRTLGAPPAVRSAMAQQSLRLAEAEPPPGEHAAMVRGAVRHAFVRAFRVTVFASAVLAALSALGALAVTRHTAHER